MNEHTILEAHADGSGQHNVDLEGANEQWPHGPLVAVVKVLGIRPCSEGACEEPVDVLHQGKLVGGIISNPEAVAVVGSFVSAKGREDEIDEGCEQGGKHQARGSAERAASDRLEGGRSISLLVGKFERFVGANKTSEEGEDRHTDATLPRNAQIWELKYSRAYVRSVGRPKQRVVESSRDVGNDDEDRGDATEALCENRQRTEPR